MRPSSVFLSILFYLCLASAWPWPPDFHNLGNSPVRRQDGGGSSSSDSKQSQSVKPGSSASAAATTKGASQSAAASTGASASGSAQPSASASGSAAASTAPPSKATGNATTPLTAASTIPPNAPPGGYSLISPAPATTTYFKIGTNITLAWNYTSLLSPPSAIDVVVSNKVSTYTLTQNASVVATPTLTWDTNQYATQENPLQNAFYTLAVFDASMGITAAPKPGELSPYGVQAQFAMYSPQAYTPLADGWVCPNCNGAMSYTEAQTLKFLGTMFLITMFTFTWFSYGFLNGF